jgi:hypothetical protein
MGKSWTSPRKKLPTIGSDRQEGSAAGLGQKRPGVKNASSTKKKNQQLIDDDQPMNCQPVGWGDQVWIWIVMRIMILVSREG